MISCVLVLRCLCRSESSYRLRFSELGMKGYYLKQIFSVGVPAGIQSSTVINFSNVLLQSSVNSFGSTAMAGYTAANNLLGFVCLGELHHTGVHELYQPELRRWKIKAHGSCAGRLHDLIGRGRCSFGMHLLWVWTGNFTDLHGGCRGNCVRYGDPCIQRRSPIFCAAGWICSRGRCAAWDIPRCRWCCRSSERLVREWCGFLAFFPYHRSLAILVYILSSVVDYHDCPAGNLFLLCETESAPEKSGARRTGSLIPQSARKPSGK